MSSDIRSSHPLFRILPPSAHPFVKLGRFDRPIGTWLLLFPGWWSIVLASGGIINLKANGWFLLVAFGAGALLMRGAGCVINDIWDIKIDAHVTRTRERPLAAGDLSKKQALTFLAALLAASFCILLTLTPLAIALGVFSLLPITVYPAMKRLTWWPQIFLGLTFNWGALMGWAAVTGGLSLSAVFLYIGGILWTLAYDTVYAHQDKADDAVVGIKSTALLWGEKSARNVSYSLGGAIVFFILAKYAATPSILTPILLLPVIGHAVWQMKGWQPDNPASALDVFRSNRTFAALLFLMFSL